MDVVKVLRASAFGLIMLLLLAAVIAGATSIGNLPLVEMCYVAGFVVAAFALVSGIVGILRKQSRVVAAALVAFLVAIACLAFVACFGYLSHDLFKVPTEVVE